jgi:hypothetical protein
VGRRPALVALAAAVVAVVALGACGSDATGDVEALVADDHAEFPSDAQPEGTRPWPEGRFTGDCAEDESGGFLCFYEDELDRQGYVCLDASTPPRVTSAAGAYAPERRFDHDGRALPPDNRCPDVPGS